MQSAMLAAVLMLPIALAAIYPCPSPSPSSEDSSGCGSDDRTYANDNQLQCAVLPGLSAAHPGPCAPPEVTAGRSRRYTPSVDDSLSIIDGLKKVEYLEWEECYNERQCAQPHWGNCTECGADDWKCSRMCEFNCGCGCIGLQTTAALDEDTYDQWEECYLKRGCTLSKKEKCQKDCAGDQSCRDSCHMERERCMCGCVQHVAATRTSTTTATTAWSTPSTTEAVTSATEVETSSTESVTGTTEAVTMTSSIEAVTSTTDAKTRANDAVTATAIIEVETTTTEVETNTTMVETTTTEVETNTTMSETNTTVVETKNTEAVTNATELEASTEKGNTSARVTTSTVDWTWRNYMTCKDQSRDCGRDSLLPEVRRDNCTCGCMGLLGGNLDMYDSSVVQNCLGDCGDQETKCDDGCRRQEPCLDSCRLSKQRCGCECNHHTHGTT